MGTTSWKLIPRSVAMTSWKLVPRCLKAGRLNNLVNATAQHVVYRSLVTGL